MGTGKNKDRRKSCFAANRKQTPGKKEGEMGRSPCGKTGYINSVKSSS